MQSGLTPFLHLLMHERKLHPMLRVRTLWYVCGTKVSGRVAAPHTIHFGIGTPSHVNTANHCVNRRSVRAAEL